VVVAWSRNRCECAVDVECSLRRAESSQCLLPLSRNRRVTTYLQTGLRGVRFLRLASRITACLSASLAASLSYALSDVPYREYPTKAVPFPPAITFLGCQRSRMRYWMRVEILVGTLVEWRQGWVDGARDFQVDCGLL